MDGKRLLEPIVARWDPRCRVTDGAHEIVLDGAEGAILHVLVCEGRAVVHDGPHAAPLGRVALPAALLARIAQDGERFDPGLLDEEAQRAIRISGDRTFFEELMNLVRRPIPAIAARFRAAEERAAARPPVRAARRLARPSPARLREAIREAAPIVLAEALPWWSRDAWTFDALAARFGDVRLPLVGARVTVRDFVAAMRDVPADRPCYTRGCLLPAEIARAVAPPVEPWDAFVAQLWAGLGPAGRAVTPLHRDATEAFLAQLAGNKRVQIYSPDQADDLYPFANWNFYQRCWVEPDAPDLARFPRFARARAIDVTIGPGEVLLLPPGWFHCVYAAGGPTLSVSFAARLDAAHVLGSSPA